MREIKFRAFIYNEMIYDLKYKEHAPINDLLKETENLMQFTGLLDKQGVEIYEGDILDVDYEVNDSFCIFEASIPDIFHENTELVTIIGNIYENPELLKGDK